MRRTPRTARLTLGLALTAALTGGAGGTALAHEPTCTDVGLGIEVHGQHIVRDYVTGGGGAADWPPAGTVGDAVGGEGAALPGGSGPGFHFPNEVAPGASFCNPQANAWKAKPVQEGGLPSQ